MTRDQVLTVRPATADDADAVQSIYARCIGEASWLPEAAKRDPVFADVSRGESIHVVVTDAGVVGFVSVQVAEPFVHHLYVHPDARGMSAGRALLASLERWLPLPWHLKCIRCNIEALKFYRRLGWAERGVGESEQGAYLLLAFGHEDARSVPLA